MLNKESDKTLKRYERQKWLEENKHKIIAYTIMITMVVFFVIYLTLAIKNNWDIHFG
jgi:maltodextrin utilization protein YvdJ